MPQVFGINSFLFQDLLRDFQVIAPPRSPVWYLSDTVIPVSLVNSQVTLDANISQTAMQFATAGTVVGPGAGAILADTGQLPAGTYLFRAQMSFLDGGAQNDILIEHRNAANSASIWAFENHSRQTVEMNTTVEWVETLLPDERLRATNRLATGGTSRRNVIIWRRFLS